MIFKDYTISNFAYCNENYNRFIIKNVFSYYVVGVVMFD